jgi:sec-independent protein translocase protein TatB
MFGMSGTELIIIIVVALLVLGPKKLPDLARSAGKALREFRKATEGIRQTVEQEFYKLDQDVGVSESLLDAPQEPAPLDAAAPATTGLAASHPKPAESVPATPSPSATPDPTGDKK